MNFKRDLPRLGAAAIAIALAGCDSGTPKDANSGLDSLETSGGSPTEIPAYCMPIGGEPVAEQPEPVLLRIKAGGAKKPGGGTTSGTTTVAPVALGAPSLTPGIGPDTAHACGVASAKLPGSPGNSGVVRECFFNGTDPTVQATVERVLESVDDTDLIHVRLTFNPHFVDNSYGTTSIGWENSKNGTHTYKDLVGSDHAELLFTNRQNAVALHVKLDYISLDASRPSGYGSLGVLGGEGSVLVGEPSHVRQVTTSLDRNLNGCGYGSYLESSPATDQNYTPNPSAANWDYRVVYELWISAEAFGPEGFGGVSIEYVHASPSKVGNNTLIVDPGPCPPDDASPPATPPQDDPTPPGGCPPGSENPGPCPPSDVPQPPVCPPGTVLRDPGTELL